MGMTRRDAIRLAAAGASAAPFLRGQTPSIAAGPFQGTRESLKTYRVPDWFRDAKFGIWAHWGPQSAAEYGDWYARNMYMEGGKQNLVPDIETSALPRVRHVVVFEISVPGDEMVYVEPYRPLDHAWQYRNTGRAGCRKHRMHRRRYCPAHFHGSASPPSR